MKKISAMPIPLPLSTGFANRIRQGHEALKVGYLPEFKIPLEKSENN